MLDFKIQNYAKLCVFKNNKKTQNVSKIKKDSKPTETVSKYFKCVNVTVFLRDTHYCLKENHITIKIFPSICFQNHLPIAKFLS